MQKPILSVLGGALLLKQRGVLKFTTLLDKSILNIDNNNNLRNKPYLFFVREDIYKRGMTQYKHDFAD